MNGGGEGPGSSFKARMAQEISAWLDTGLISEEQAGLAAAGMALVCIIAAGIRVAWWHGEPDAQTVEVPVTQSGGQSASQGTQTAQQPSIAVLPFQLLSDDNKQEYFSDGITNDIITDLPPRYLTPS